MAEPSAPRGAPKRRRPLPDPVAGKTLDDYPHLLVELDPALNPGLATTPIAAGSHLKLSWRCSTHRDHIWEAPVVRRTSYRTGCPYCAGKLVSPSNSLARLFPDVAAELDGVLNGRLTACQLTSKSHETVWWRCKRNSNHSWRAKVATRTSGGSGCPQCSLWARSRFEVHAGELVRGHTGLDVVFDMKMKVPGHHRVSRIDLAIPEIRHLFDLDPAYWHQNAARDQRKIDLLAGLPGWTYVRVREIGAPPLIGNTVEAPYCPQAFALALRPILEPLCGWYDLDDLNVDAALDLADMEWERLLDAEDEQFTAAA